MFARAASLCAFAFGAVTICTAPAFASFPPPFAHLNRDVRSLARHVPGAIALDVVDISTGYNAGFNAAKSMPAASTIKLPVMVAVFEQLAAGRFDLNRRMTLQAQDKDYGSGDLSDAPDGSGYTVSELLDKMIDISDNTATNMLIRLVGRRNINREMIALGLERTHLSGDVRTDAWSVRATLRTSAADLVRLLALMAKGELVDEWSSNEMISILEADRINTLLPEPLPADVPIAHKTGSFFDTLNDAGIVFASDAPYAIAVMTTALPSQDLGREFIHRVSRLAYADELGFARWRAMHGPTEGTSPDVPYWAGAAAAGAGLPPKR
ncbi:MAG TPA: serine hydrolase [Candidatus Cybelea sp.]|jgi:beta-lactamase class A|nr:serine hydrolase [Candidatus Cybelea sp.]